MTAPILVAGIGNIFLTDDGFGPEVVTRLASQPTAGWGDSNATTPVRVVDYGIRGMHLAYDVLDGCTALVLVDAIATDAEPGVVTVVQVRPEDLGEGEFDAHGMNPVAVLASLEALGGTLPPTYVVGCRPADVTDGMGLSPTMAGAVDEAVAVVRDVVDNLLSNGCVPTKAGA